MQSRWIEKFFPLFAAVLLTGLLAAGCERGPKGRPQMPPPEVATVAVSTQKIALTTELPGRTSAFRVAEIRPQASGLLQKRFFTEGADVKAGQVLYQIDPAPFQAVVDSAQANLAAMKKSVERARASLAASIAGVARYKATLDLAKANSARLEELVKDRAVSVSDYDQSTTETTVTQAALKAAEAQAESERVAVAVAEAAIEQARAALKTAQINLDYTRIIAPISGRIGRSAVTEGAIVTAYQPLPLATIQQLDPMYVDVPQSTGELLRLKQRTEEGRLDRNGKGQQMVDLLLEDGTRYPSQGTLQFRDISVDPSTASVMLRVVFPNPEGSLLPGMFVRAVVQEGINDQAILIPQQAVARDPKGNPMVMVVDAQDTVSQRMLSIDRAVGAQWLVTEGLSAGDRIIVEGVQKVRPGATVKTVPFEDSASTQTGTGTNRAN